MVSPVQVQRFLSGIDYPVSKEDLVNHARDKGADENIIEALEKLPEQTYESANDVSQAIGRMR